MRDESSESDRAIPEGFDSWNAYWTAQGMPWRTEPEIGMERQAYLAERRATPPNIERGIYPFRDEHGSIKLTRPEVEWLLATNESGGMRGPVDRNDFRQLNRKGLDLRGADLRGLDLSDLPLAHTRFGLEMRDWSSSTPRQQSWAAAQLDDVRLTDAYLERAVFRCASLKRADLRGTRLHRGVLHQADLTDALLRWANLADASLIESQLSGCDLRLSFANVGTALHGAILSTPKGNAARLADVSWVGVNLAVVDWTRVQALGDEQAARNWRLGVNPVIAQGQVPRKKARVQRRKSRREALQTAIRANRQLATALRGQGLNEASDRFAYRAQQMQRLDLRQRHHYLRYLGSLLLDLLAGYGYRPGRSILVYLTVILWFANFYVWASHGLFSLGLPPTHIQPLRWYEGLILSVSSFHGRGFQPFQNLNDPIAALAGMQAVLGLIIEVSFIATFTQRFFAR